MVGNVSGTVIPQSITWWRHGEQDSLMTCFRVRIQNVRFSDAGVYRCEGWNRWGRKDTEATLTVRAGKWRHVSEQTLKCSTKLIRVTLYWALISDRSKNIHTRNCSYQALKKMNWRVCLQNGSYPKLEFWDDRLFIFYCQCFWCKNKVFMGAWQWDTINLNKNKVGNIHIRLVATGFHRYLNFLKLAHDAFCKQTLQICPSQPCSCRFAGSVSTWPGG